MNVMWLRPHPRPDRPAEHVLIGTATIRGLRAQLLPWQGYEVTVPIGGCCRRWCRANASLLATP